MALLARYASMAILMVIGIFGSIVYVIAEIPSEHSSAVMVSILAWALMSFAVGAYNFSAEKSYASMRIRDIVTSAICALGPVSFIFALSILSRENTFGFATWLDHFAGIELNFDSKITHEPRVDDPILLSVILTITMFIALSMSSADSSAASQKKKAQDAPSGYSLGEHPAEAPLFPPVHSTSSAEDHDGHPRHDAANPSLTHVYDLYEHKDEEMARQQKKKRDPNRQPLDEFMIRSFASQQDTELIPKAVPDPKPKPTIKRQEPSTMSFADFLKSNN